MCIIFPSVCLVKTTMSSMYDFKKSRGCLKGNSGVPKIIEFCAAHNLRWCSENINCPAIVANTLEFFAPIGHLVNLNIRPSNQKLVASCDAKLSGRLKKNPDRSKVETIESLNSISRSLYELKAIAGN